MKYLFSILPLFLFPIGTLLASDFPEDIYGPIPLDETAVPWLPFLGIFFCIFLGGIAGYFFYRQKKKAGILSYWQQALDDIDKLRPIQKENDIVYLAELSAIVRHYIETRFALGSTRQTTYELFHDIDLQHHAQLLPFQQDLRCVLEQADMAKFACAQLSEQELQRLEKAVRHFVQQTNPQSEKTKNPSGRGAT